MSARGRLNMRRFWAVLGECLGPALSRRRLAVRHALLNNLIYNCHINAHSDKRVGTDSREIEDLVDEVIARIRPF